MKLHQSSMFVVQLCMAFALVMTARAENGVDENLFVYLKDGKVEAFPTAWITSRDISGGVLRIAVDRAYFSYEMAQVDSISHIAPTDLPTLVSLKFNNKYNDQLFTDAIATIEDDRRINATVGCIGKWLTPSFQLSSEEAVASIGGKIQKSHVTRSNFADDVTFTVAHANQTILDRTKVSDEIWSEPEKYIITKLQLTEDMLSTNAPTNEGEGLGMMLDGDPATYFHPSNGNDNTAPDPYIDIHLGEEVSMIQFTYTLRKDLSRYPKELCLYASKDGNEWTLKETYTRETGLPYKVGETFTSPLIDLGDSYTYLRILQTQANYKKNLFFVEFGLSKVTENPDTIPVLIQPTVYDYHFIPWGRDYTVHVDWLADQANDVPRIDIDIEDFQFVSSKSYYLNADINIDGGVVYPSMKDKVQIKGRGNSSWSNYAWAKNPYRLKFEEKVKPFGMTKGKNWVLLANKQEGSMMANAIGMKIAAVVGTAAYNHILPVELYLNGYYWGSYNFTEKVGFHNNSIDIEDEQNAALLELDTYYDETYRFHSDPYNLPVNIKNPDLNEQGSNLDFNTIKDDFNAFVNALKNGDDITAWVDVDYLARYLMANDLICNYEINHPKSTYLYKEDYLNGSKYIFGPVWDLDWAFGYEHSKKYATTDMLSDFYTSSGMERQQFIQDLRYVSEAVDKAYYKVWTHFMQDHLQEVLDYCDSYYEYAKTSFQHNNDNWFWGDETDYGEMATRMKEWLKTRAENIYANLTPYDIDDEDDEPNGIETLPTTPGDHPLLADVYDLRGVCVKKAVPVMELRQHLSPGMYIVNGKKMIVR